MGAALIISAVLVINLTDSASGLRTENVQISYPFSTPKACENARRQILEDLRINASQANAKVLVLTARCHDENPR